MALCFHSCFDVVVIGIYEVKETITDPAKIQVSNLTNGLQITRFPSALGLTACESNSITKDVGEAFSNELSLIGINWVYEPVLDVVTELTEPLDASRRFGGDAGTVSGHALAFTQGLHTNHIASCAIETLAATIEEIYTSMNQEEPGDEAARAVEQDELESLEQLIGSHCLDSLQLSSTIHGLQNPVQLGRSIQATVRLVLRERLDFQGPVILDCSTFPSESMACPKHAPLRALMGDCDMVRLSNNHAIQIASIQAIYSALKSADLNNTANAAAALRVSKLKERCTSWTTCLAPRTDPSTIYATNAGLALATYRASITALTDSPTPLLNLPPPSVLVLLSPTVLSPLNPTSAAASDPFEPLGRALSRSHARIRHVPYTVSAGLTGTHLAFLSRASAVVLVLCNASSAFTEAQEEFTSAVRRVVAERESGRGVEVIRKIVLGAGDPRDLRGNWRGWWGVCCYEYTRGALEAVAEVITGQRVATGALPVRLR